MTEPARKIELRPSTVEELVDACATKIAAPDVYDVIPTTAAMLDLACRVLAIERRLDSRPQLGL